jgi:hypothetical protein
LKGKRINLSLSMSWRYVRVSGIAPLKSQLNSGNTAIQLTIVYIPFIHLNLI